MKNNRGITLIALAITIIVITIIASVVTYSGMQALRDSKESAQLSEVGMVQQAVLENYTKYKTTGNYEYMVGTPITNYDEVTNVINELNSKSSETINLKLDGSYYYYAGCSGIDRNPYYYYELKAEDLKKLGITQEEDVFVVNYLSGEVINKTLLTTRTGKPLYTYAQQLDPLSPP